MAISSISWPPGARLLFGLSHPIHLLHSCSQTSWLPPSLLRPTETCLEAPPGRSCTHLPLLLHLPCEGELGHGAAGQLLLSPPIDLLSRHPCSPLTQDEREPHPSCHHPPLPCCCARTCSPYARPLHPVPGSIILIRRELHLVIALIACCQVNVIFGATHVTFWMAWILFNWAEGTHMVTMLFSSSDPFVESSLTRVLQR